MGPVACALYEKLPSLTGFKTVSSFYLVPPEFFCNLFIIMMIVRLNNNSLITNKKVKNFYDLQTSLVAIPSYLFSELKVCGWPFLSLHIIKPTFPWNYP